MKDLAVGLIGLSVSEYYDMTLGNFTRKSLGWIKNTWITQRELIATICSIMGEKVTGNDVFSFGEVKKESTMPTKADREYMEKRHANTMRLTNG